MKNNKIRLTESQLQRLIKESVKKVLKEFNDPGEEERYGFPEDYDDYNPFDREHYHGKDSYTLSAYNRYLKHSEALKNGEYDDRLHDDDFVGDIITDCATEFADYDSRLEREIQDRLYVINKDYAFHNAMDPDDDYNKGANRYKNTSHYDWQGIERQQREQPNPRQKRREMIDAWEDREFRERANQHPDVLRKDGNGYRKKYRVSPESMLSAKDKLLYGTDQADKRPLHRKASLNRELDESIRKAIKKSLN